MKPIKIEMTTGEIMDPPNSCELGEFRITSQTLRGSELQVKASAITTVDDIAQITPEAWTMAIFDWLLRLHEGDYEAYAQTCRRAALMVKDQAKAA